MLLFFKVLILVVQTTSNEQLTGEDIPVRVRDNMSVYKSSDCDGDPLTAHEQYWVMNRCNYDPDGSTSVGRIVSCINPSSILHQEFKDSECNEPADPIELYNSPICSPFEYNGTTLYVQHEFECNMDKINVCESPLLNSEEACTTLDSCAFVNGRCSLKTSEPTIIPTSLPTYSTPIGCVDNTAALLQYELDINCSDWIEVSKSQDPYEPWCDFMFLDRFRFGDYCCETCLDYTPKPAPPLPSTSAKPSSLPTSNDLPFNYDAYEKQNCYGLLRDACWGPSFEFGQVCIWDAEDFKCRSEDFSDLGDYFICDEIEIPALCSGDVGYGFSCVWNLMEEECQAQLTGGEGADVMPYPGTTPCKEIPTAEVCSGMTECRWDNGACESIYSVIVGSGNIVSPQFTEPGRLRNGRQTSFWGPFLYSSVCFLLILMGISGLGFLYCRHCRKTKVPLLYEQNCPKTSLENI